MDRAQEPGTTSGGSPSAVPGESRSASRSGDAAPTSRATCLDAASSEPLHPAARAALLAALDRGYADPRRRHGPAADARALLDNARAVVAQCLGVRPDEVTFTGSGTSAVHRGLLGLTRRPAPAPVVVSAVEHQAVLHAARWRGATVEVPVDSQGRCVGLASRVRELHDAGTGAGPGSGGVAAVALQSANHEVATLQDLDDLDLPADVPLFVDACASMGRMALPGGPWSALAGSAHKWGGPAGLGVLVVRRGARWHSPFPDDDRLEERASGFENVPAALAAAAALQAVVAERSEVGARQHAQVARIRAAAARVPDTEVVGDPERRLPHLVTFSCLYVAGDAIVDALARHGFAVASGSACTASSLIPSHVLAAMGALTHGNVRVSLSRDTTDSEVDRFCTVLPGVVAGLRE